MAMAHFRALDLVLLKLQRLNMKFEIKEGEKLFIITDVVEGNVIGYSECIGKVLIGPHDLFSQDSFDEYYLWRQEKEGREPELSKSRSKYVDAQTISSVDYYDWVRDVKGGRIVVLEQEKHWVES